VTLPELRRRLRCGGSYLWAARTDDYYTTDDTHREARAWIRGRDVPGIGDVEVSHPDYTGGQWVRVTA